jgi:hypothetical protein
MGEDILIIDGLQWQLHPDEDPAKLKSDIQLGMVSGKRGVREVRLANNESLLLNCGRLRYVYVGAPEIFEGTTGFESAPSVKTDLVKPVG